MLQKKITILNKIHKVQKLSFIIYSYRVCKFKSFFISCKKTSIIPTYILLYYNNIKRIISQFYKKTILLVLYIIFIY